MAEDFGSDVAGTTLNIGNKAMDIILELFKQAFQSWNDRDGGKEARARKKEQRQQENARLKLDVSSGEMALRTLEKSGEPLRCVMADLPAEDISVLSEAFGREGIVFSALEGKKGADGKKKCSIIVRERDLERVDRAVHTYRDIVYLRELDNRINELENKQKSGAELTPIEKEELKELKERKADIQSEICEEMNEVSWSNTMDGIESGVSAQPVSVEEALNRWTGKDFDRDIHSVVVDTEDPSKVVRCHGYGEKGSDGKTRSITDYTVYRSGKKIQEFTDRDTRDVPGAWPTRRKEIAKAAGFTGSCYKFRTEEEYGKWCNFVGKQNEQEIEQLGLEKPTMEKDFTSISDNLSKKLKENGAELREDGEAYDIYSGTPCKERMKDETLSRAETATAAENVIVAEQIGVYREMGQLRDELVVARAEASTLGVRNTPEGQNAKDHVSSLESRLSKLESRETELTSARKNINAEQGRENGKARGKEKDVQTREKKAGRAAPPKTGRAEKER